MLHSHGIGQAGKPDVILVGKERRRTENDVDGNCEQKSRPMLKDFIF